MPETPDAPDIRGHNSGFAIQIGNNGPDIGPPLLGASSAHPGSMECRSTGLEAFGQHAVGQCQSAARLWTSSRCRDRKMQPIVSAARHDIHETRSPGRRPPRSMCRRQLLK